MSDEPKSKAVSNAQLADSLEVIFGTPGDTKTPDVPADMETLEAVPTRSRNAVIAFGKILIACLRGNPPQHKKVLPYKRPHV